MLAKEGTPHRSGQHGAWRSVVGYLFGVSWAKKVRVKSTLFSRAVTLHHDIPPNRSIVMKVQWPLQRDGPVI